MNMLGSQADRLRLTADIISERGVLSGDLAIIEIRLREAADTIESLRDRLQRAECEFVIEDNMNESEGMGDVWFRCTNCDTKYDYYADDWLMKQNYCPHCGFKIRKAVKR